MFHISKRNMFDDMLSLQDAMSELFTNSFVQNPLATQEKGWGGSVPALDVSETEDAYIVEATVPGVKAEDLNVTVENNVLTISGETVQEKADEQQTYHYRERSYGQFRRTLTLPNTVKPDDIRASLNDGVLRLELPKAEETKPRRISVNVGEKQLTA